MSTPGTEHNKTEHCYVEVGGDLLSKPSTLSDLLERQGYPTTLVFCNTPSDTDLLEVLLKKRGIPATKLIGYVPPQKLEKTLERLRNREISTIVVTDIAARNLNIGEFDMVLNYSIQNDGDLYLERAGLGAGAAAEAPAGSEDRPARTPAKKIVSLIGPLDVANFHFLKKAANVEFTKIEAPSKEEVVAARVENLAARASKSPIGQDASYLSMASKVLSHPQKDAIVAVLIQSALEVVPQLSADLEKAVAERDAFSIDDDLQPGSLRHGGSSDDDRGGRGGNQRGGRGRGGRDRGGRRNDYDNRGGGRGYEGRGQGGGRFNDEGDSFQGGREEGNAAQSGEEGDFSQEGGYDQGEYRGGRGRGGRGGRRGDRDNYDREGRGHREDRAPRNLIRIKDDRLYIGQGSRDGFSEDQFVSLITEQGVTREQLKSFSLRDKYSFADLPEEVSAKVLDALKDREVGGKKLFITKAVTLTTTHEGPPDAAAEGDSDQAAGHDMDSHSGEEDVSSGPNTLEDTYQ